MALLKMVNGVEMEMTAEDILGMQATAAATQAARLEQYAAQIDADADAIYRDAVGNRVPEYEAAEKDATAFIESDYNPPPPEFVRSYADAAGLTSTEAANNIISQAAAWRVAMAAIRSSRLSCKAAVRGESPEAAIAQWNAFVVAIRQQLGIA